MPTNLPDGIEFVRADSEGGGAALETIYKAVEEALNGYRMRHTLEAPDLEHGLSLVDRLSPDEDKDVTRGREELDALIDHVCGSVGDVFRAAVAEPTATMAREEIDSNDQQGEATISLRDALKAVSEFCDQTEPFVGERFKKQLRNAIRAVHRPRATSAAPGDGLQRRLYDECITAQWDSEKRNTFGEEIAHLHEELSEAFRAWRRYKDCGVREVNGKLEGVPIEFADVLIGLFYNAELHGFDLLEAVERKHQFNLTRNYVTEGRQLHPPAATTTSPAAQPHYERLLTTEWDATNARRHELTSIKAGRELSESEAAEFRELQWLAALKRELLSGPSPAAASKGEQRIDFSCRVCGVQCDSAPDPPARAVCPEHCEDHDYEYQRSERGTYCNHCGQQALEDWHDD